MASKTRKIAPMTTPVALTIAGSDSSGGAGIQADLKTFAAFGVYGASAITALTAQNTHGVSGIHAVPADFVTAQIDAVFSDLEVGAVKIGMVAQAASIDAIAAALARWKPGHVVLDPVMVATSGDRLLAAEAVEALRKKLIPLASVITPNLPEAAALLDEPVATSEAEIESQGRRLLALGSSAVLIKGGHGEGAESIDYLVDAESTIALAAPRVATDVWCRLVGDEQRLRLGHERITDSDDGPRTTRDDDWNTAPSGASSIVSNRSSITSSTMCASARARGAPR